MHESSIPYVHLAKPWGLWATLFFSGLVFGAFFLTQYLVFLLFLAFKFAQPPGLEPDALAGNLAFNGFALAIATFISTPVCIGLIFIFAKLRKQLSIHDYLGLKKPTRRQVLEWCLVAIVCNVALDLLKSFIDLPIIPKFVSTIYETAYFLPLLYLALVIVGPLFEELFFRGFLFKGIKHSALKTPGAIVLPTLLWLLIHRQYEWFDIASVFIFGLVLSVARIRTKTIYVPLAMHALSSFFALTQAALGAHLL